MTRPLGGTLEYSFRRCWVEVMADRTDRRLTRDLMLEAVPNSSANILAARETWYLGAVHSEWWRSSVEAAARLKAHVRMMSEIMDVPFPRAASRRLMSFLTFQISMFFSASLGWGSFDDIFAAWVRECGV